MIEKVIVHNILVLTTLALIVSLSHGKTSQKSEHFMEYLRIDVRHIDSKKNLSRFEFLQRMSHRSHQRINHLARITNNLSQFGSKIASGAKTDVHLGQGEYVMDVAIGTPSLSFPAIIDTGSDLIWTQCKPCERCFKQPTAIFNPSTSSTFKLMPCTANLCKALPVRGCSPNNMSCEYWYPYADESSTAGYLSSETFTLGSQNTNNVAFGCAVKNTDGFYNTSGLIGLGRGPLSLVSQLGFTKFSHCFSLDLQKQSPMFFGSLANLNPSAATGPTQSTPLLRNRIVRSYYYLSLLGITVGGTKLDIPSSVFALKSDGTNGMTIDSGTTYTYLHRKGYNVVKRAFKSLIKFPVANTSNIEFDLCFSAPSSASFNVPKLILHFDGADLDLPEKNYFIHDINTGLLCLTIMESPGLSVLGSMQQQNFFVTYDLQNDKLSFTPTQCDKL
jgi:Xylanase inhibitor N-terminal/Xylanase inhibitor C-terminal